MRTRIEEFEKWWAIAPYCVSTTSAARAAWQVRQQEIEALELLVKMQPAPIDVADLQAKIDAANARIKELDAVNLALIAEKNILNGELESLKAYSEGQQESFDVIMLSNIAMKAELAELNAQEPVAWRKEIVRNGISLGYVYPTISHSKIQSECEKLYAKPMPPAIPNSLRLLAIEEVRESMGTVVVGAIDGARHHIHISELAIVDAAPKQGE